MLLYPKGSKYKKSRKGKLLKLEFRNNKLKFGRIALKAAKSGTITARQIEATRQTIVRRIKRKGKLWIRIFPNNPITAKPTEIRMGKGKGALNHWGIRVRGGTVLFEISGVALNRSASALKAGGSKLPIKTLIYD